MEKEKPLRWVGKSLPFLDAAEKATGLAQYLDDLRWPGILTGRALRSRYPHARVRHIETGPAKEIPGVFSVLTAFDVPGENRLGPHPHDPPAIAGDRVRYRGDVVALVAAESPEAAEEALAAIEVEYEPLPVVEDPLLALVEGAPALHPGGNLLNHTKLRKGDIEAGFARSAVIVEGEYRTPCVDHLYLETEGALAAPGPNVTMAVWGPSQQPFAARQRIARALGVGEEAVHYVATLPGGAFGGKSEASADVGVRVALLGRACGRPVRLVYTREESLTTSAKRHPAVLRYRSGASREGLLQAVRAEIFLDKGAYSAFGGAMPPALRRATHHAVGPYDVPNVWVDVYCVHTNNPYGGQMRAPGCPQVAFAMESQMDELAERLGVDPLEIRRRNALEVGSVTASGQLLRESVGLRVCLDRVAEAIEPLQGAGRPLNRLKPPSRHEPPSGRRVQGRGIACCWYGTGNEYSGAMAHLYLDAGGGLRLAAGVVDFGQGSKTVLSQIAAEVLGVPFGRFRVGEVDTSLDPAGGTSTSSRITMQVGNAVAAAARNARWELLKLAGDVLEAPSEDLELEEGIIFAKGRPEARVTLEDLARRYVREKPRLIGSGAWEPIRGRVDPETGQGDPWQVYAFGAQVAEVEVDRETGEVAVLRVVAAHDVGRAISPAGVEMQIEGGVYMGLSFGLMEELIQREGETENPDLAGYLVPSALDMPEAILPLVVEASHEGGPFGAKGAGEPPNIPTAAAIANAIYNALGVRMRTLPITPERIRKALSGS